MTKVVLKIGIYDCRHGKECTSFESGKCPFNHVCVKAKRCRDNDCKLFHGDMCKYDKCTNKDCKFVHLMSKTHTVKPPCKFGYKCTKKDCKFLHPKKKLCRDGIKCTREKCSFSHPEKTPCKFGVKCKNKECKFFHEHLEEPEKKPSENSTQADSAPSEVEIKEATS